MAQPRADRVARGNAAPLRPERAFVLYWMIATRRTRFSFALEHAVARAQELRKPLVVLEPLRVDYPWASDRLHRFVLDGMADNARALAGRPVLYYPYVEPRPGAGRGLVAALAAEAALVVTDDYPTFFLPRMVARTAARLDVRLERVDSNGVVPLGATETEFKTALAFRRYVQRTLAEHLACVPAADPLARVRLPRLAALPAHILSRWPPTERADPGQLPLDHGVAPVVYRGGARAAEERLAGFLERPIDHYAGERNEPARDATSGLSPYLHFGHLSVHEVLAAIADRETWSTSSLSRRASGRREGFWGLAPSIEAFLDQLVTWREVGFQLAARRPEDHTSYASLPDWARATLDRHRRDERPWCYDLAALDGARTHDPLWNAAQTQLVREGRIHTYLRMLWGKKILEWSSSPDGALEAMIRLNDRYAVDGRDPNSYCGIGWVLGRFDRPWAPERPIFGWVRYMSSASAARKLKLGEYLERYAPAAAERRSRPRDRPRSRTRSR
jgi:deoxyribodipyrimidine photo-lyase